VLNLQVAALSLQSHPDLDIKTFFKLKMKFLPAVMSWFERVRSQRNGRLILDNRSYQSRDLSALYEQVRAMPDLTIIGYWEGRMIHIEAEKRRLAEEMRRLDYEEDITRERVGMSGKPMDEASASRNKRMRLEYCAHDYFISATLTIFIFTALLCFEHSIFSQ
jgi:hypothetical protein